MSIAALERHLLWSGPNGSGGTTTYYYYDETTWIVVAVALAWLAWVLVRRRMRARALRRPPRRADYSLLKRVVRLKHELSLTFLRPGFSANIHAVGVGTLATSGEYCIQVFVGDANAEMWAGAGAETLPDAYGGVPIVLIEMPVATFLSDAGSAPSAARNQNASGIREMQEIIIGGISGANANLTGQSGTIGYFCTRKSRLPRRREIYLLSNSHVFADLRKAKVEDGDLIMQPSPGERASSRPIGTLVNFSALKFEGDIGDPNHVDAALARLWETHAHRPVIPFIGAVKGHVEKSAVEIGEPARKFGRTTEYTEGCVFSIYMDIWIRYDRTGQSAFFENQILIEPATPQFPKFVDKGDSGSLLVNAEQHALGLIFAGASPDESEARGAKETSAGEDGKTKRIEGCGVANPISEVLARLKIELPL